MAKRVTAVVGRDKAGAVVAQVVGLVAEERFSGPIAHPRHLREYEDICPGSADRIISMAERNLTHLHKMQEKALDGEIQETAIILFLAPVAGGVLYQAGYDQYAAERTREYAKHADDQVGNACRRGAPAEKVICFANARIEGDLKKHDNERNEADLVAQRKTALWTMLMGAAAFVGMALSLVGVILVFRTFGATREAKSVKLILESHNSGPDKDIGWSEREWAEILAHAKQLKVRSDQPQKEWVTKERP